MKDLNIMGGNCHCGEDHNRLAWVAYFVLAQLGVPPKIAWQFGEEIEKLAVEVGYVRASEEPEALRGYVADHDALIDMPTVAEPKPEPRYDLINDTVYVEEDDQ